MPFRKVQYKTGHSPVEHKFFVSERTLERFPDMFKAVDKQTYAAPGRTEFATLTPAGDQSAVVAPVDGVHEEGESHGN